MGVVACERHTSYLPQQKPGSASTTGANMTAHADMSPSNTSYGGTGRCLLHPMDPWHTDGSHMVTPKDISKLDRVRGQWRTTRAERPHRQVDWVPLVPPEPCISPEHASPKDNHFSASDVIAPLRSSRTKYKGSLELVLHDTFSRQATTTNPRSKPFF